MHRALHRVAAVLAATTLGTALLASPATASETGLSGIVTDDTGTPIAACVTVYDQGYDWVEGTCTEDGAWSLPDLADGNAYRVRVDASDGYISEWAQDAREFWDATDFVAPATVDVSLARGGVLTGTLTDGEGAPVPWASVNAVRSSDEWDQVENASTDEAGAWRMVVPPGSYKVQMSNWPAQVWAFGATTFAQGATLEVAAGQTVQVDDHFAPAAKVSGRITDAKDKRPVAGACATLLPLTGDDTGQEFGSGCADDTGAYSFTAFAAGSFLVRFTDPGGRYAAEYSGGSSSADKAKAVKVVEGRTTTASATLEVGAVVTGRVVDAKSGEGIEGVCPSAHIGRSWDWVPGQSATCTSAEGTYRLGGLPADPTTLLLTPPWQSGLAQTWYLGATDVANATVLKLKTGRVATLADTRLGRAGTVTGVVTDDLGNPVPNVHVNLQGSYGGRSGGCENPLCGYTDENGRYTILAPPGTYTPVFWTYDGDWAPEWSGDADTRSTGTPITVSSDEETTLDAALSPGAHVRGSVVTSSGGAPTVYVAGYVFTEAGDYIGDFDAYEDNGWTFTSSPLPSGRFRLVADLFDGSSGTSTRVWYDGSSTEDGATLVPLTRGETADITFHLP